MHGEKEILREKDNIKIWFSDETFHTFSEKKNADRSQKKSAFPFSRRIIYEDEHILIVDKPAGILTQSDNSNESSLNDALLDYCHYNIIPQRSHPYATVWTKIQAVSFFAEKLSKVCKCWMKSSRTVPFINITAVSS